MTPLYHRMYTVEPRQVVFINDVFFSAEDVQRLLSHNADIACGMDFSSRNNIRSLVVGRWSFYDTWVSRSHSGRKFNSQYPYLQEEESIKRIKAGLPIPSIACWNGMIVLSSVPFLTHGLRFRTALPDGECKHCEASLICEDFLRLGYPNVIVDPSVRVVYLRDHDYYLYSTGQLSADKFGVREMPWTKWGDTLLKPADPEIFDLAYGHKNYECYESFLAGTRMGRDGVDLYHRSKRIVNLLSPNYTEVFFNRLKELGRFNITSKYDDEGMEHF
jgi:hypothetical protein